MANFADSFFRGAEYGAQAKERREDSAFRRLAGDYYSAPPEQRDALRPQLAALNPERLFQIDSQFDQRDSQRQKRQIELVTNTARLWSGVPAAAKPQAYAVMRQRLVETDPQMGQWLPEQYDEATVEGLVKQVMGAGGSEVFAQKVGSDGYIYNTMRDGSMVNTGVKADRQMWFANNPGVDPYLVGKDGTVNMVAPGNQPVPPRPPPPDALVAAGPDGVADPGFASLPAAARMRAAELEAAGQPFHIVNGRLVEGLSAGVMSEPGQMPPQAAPTAAGGGLPAPGGGGGGAAPDWLVAPPGQVPGGNPLRRPVPAPKVPEESFGQPQAVTDPATGKVKMVQFGNRGGVREVSDYAPAPTDRDAKPPTEGERGAAGYLGRMRAAEQLLSGISAGGYKPNVTDHYTAGQGPLRNWAASAEGQKWRQAQEDWVRAKLRKESGAAIPTEEMDREITMYFPQPGDQQGVIDQKAASRREAEAQLVSMAGRALPAGAAGTTPAAGGYQIGQVIELNGKRYRVTGGDPADPDVEEIQ